MIKKSQLSSKELKVIQNSIGCFLKWWYPTTIGFPTENDHFEVFWVYHHFWKPAYGSCLQPFPSRFQARPMVLFSGWPPEKMLSAVRQEFFGGRMVPVKYGRLLLMVQKSRTS